jgi:hypothetical protein
MTDSHDLDPNLPADERARLAVLAERLERDRPVPRPSFRGDLRRHLLTGPRRSAAPATRFRLLAAGYTAAGTLCLLVAGVGLAGVGPFAA